MIKRRMLRVFKLNFFVMLLTFSMLFSFPVKADSLISDSFSERVSFGPSMSTAVGYYKQGASLTDISNYMCENLESNKYYRIDYRFNFELGLDRYLAVDSFNLNMCIKYPDYVVSGSSEDTLYYNLFHQDQVINLNSNYSTNFSDEGFLIVVGNDLGTPSFDFDFSFTTLYMNNSIAYTSYFVFEVLNFTELSSSEFEIYQKAFYEGYYEGAEVGYNQGYSNGHSEGYRDGFVAGTDEGYQDGFDAGVDEGYQSGNHDGYTSGWDEGYDEGFENGNSLGYDYGYFEGSNSGYNEGYDDGILKGESDGYSSGYEEGFDSGYSSGSIDGYDTGFSDGAGSVDTDSYYQSGYEAGAGSVDTDSYYQSGYVAGLNSAFKPAYDEGYAAGVQFGYSEGYQEGIQKAEDKYIENLSSTGTSAGKMFSVEQNVNESKSVLQISDCNTLLPFTFEYSYGEDYEFDYEREFENYDYETTSSTEDDYITGDTWGLYSDGYYDGSFSYEIDTRIDFNTGTNGSKVDETYFKELTKKFEKWHSWGYYYMAPQKLFTADPKYYAYKITLYQWDTTYSGKNINWIRNTVGEWSDIMSGESNVGLGFYNGAGGQFTYTIVTDNLPIDIYSALLMYFYNDDAANASFNLNGKLRFDITPYSRNEYAGIMSGIDDLQSDINDRFGDLNNNLNKNFDDLMNSYDTSKGDQLNGDFKASLIDFETAENSLFDTAKGSLEGFTFFDFESVPAMLSGISIVTGLMTSVYNAMGGASGASGIVLSILFSVMLISMILGLGKHYQSASRRAETRQYRERRSKSDHVKGSK